MGQPIDYFHKRLSGIEKTLSDINVRLSKADTERDALEHRVKKLEKGGVSIEATLARYIRTRLAIDNDLRRRTAGVAFDLGELQERLNAVEVAGFPDVSGEIARVIGQSRHGGDDKTKALDRRKSKDRR